MIRETNTVKQPCAIFTYKRSCTLDSLLFLSPSATTHNRIWHHAHTQHLPARDQTSKTSGISVMPRDKGYTTKSSGTNSRVGTTFSCISGKK
jgi:hypothetical protein